jgi:phosphotransferase system HPr (HPr) family protein
MQTVELTLRNASGLHARPAALFIQAAAKFASKITVENLDRATRPVDAKSILMVLTIGVGRGQRVRVTADGPDEAEAIAALESAIRAGLGEPVGDDASE